MTEQPLPRDLIIVGSGPAGYTAAIYAARAGLAPLVIAGSVTAGGALMNTTEVENFPGFPDGIQGPELMENLQKQAEKFGAEILWDDVVKMDLTGDVKTVELGSGDVFRAVAVILSTGSAYRELGLPDEKRLSGRGVSWCATCDGFFFRDQDILVVGGGDSAVEEATFLTRFGKSVTIVHRRDDLRASKIMADRAKANPKINFAWNSEVVAIHGTEKVTGVTLRDTVTGAEREVGAAGVFVAIGHVPRSELVVGQVDVDENGYIEVVGRTTATNLPGVFACGDVVDHTYRQAITAAGTGCSAAIDAQNYLAALAHVDPASPSEIPAALVEEEKAL
ncbi:thioredoxin-disulfide reductase [Cellulomonas chengniuliangii]|uniref:Thioredoxin reductase n=1 Tax=Cellulomonas chengniuliangii TaxID=2968084 RepID=A0ABY5L097_9CELL|nr:thioredoxin-disulfide reductase [Cellulomonas chengniuliangii]MCC2307903.1 thioredoxin-disulfide reductase [Cellulomonas chengniuliangii]MCC2318425.1 thioredoxin-disulfide reductase [Cellulomonas chengniuliangii]UUI75348.1 thioredoxin-disulfide reductase [Cellulomonas chengniuliangii]